MHIRDSFAVEAPVEAVWEFLQDIPRVAACMPGLESVEQVGPEAYKAVFKVGVGPVRATFAGRATIIERIPTTRIVAKIEGQDSATATSVKADFTATLSGEDGSSRLEVEMEFAMRGRLSQFGSAVMIATSKKLTARFARNLQEAIK